jgi:hypothetical protein
MNRTCLAGLAAAAVLAAATPALPTAVQIDAGNTALLFGGTDAEGGIGDWYVSNGVVEAIIDDVGPVPDLVGVVPPASVPPMQSEINPTGGSLLDAGRVGADDDQLAQMFTVGGLSTSNFILYTGISAPTADTVRASGGLLLPPVSVAPSPCVAIETDFTAAGSDPFLTITTRATNNCGANAPFGGFLDAFIWTLRGIVPFSAGGLGFDHPILDLANPAPALELPTFLAAPGTVGPADGIMDPANGTASGEVSYGLVPVQVVVDQDGAGPIPPVVTAVNAFFGVSSTLVTALGNLPTIAALSPGGTLAYTRRLHVGARNDVRSVADTILPDLASRTGFATGTISGDVDAADTADVAASILVTRLGRCSGNPGITCTATAPACAGAGTCTDPVPTTGFPVGGKVSHVRTDATGAFAGVVLPAGEYQLRVSAFERDDVVVGPLAVAASADTPVVVPALSARGTVAFTVRERRPGMPPLPAKLVFKGVPPTPDPALHRDLPATLGGSDVHAETFGGTQEGPSGHAAGQGNVVYTATGEGSIQLRPGTYEVWATRGMEYNVRRREVTVTAGGTASADFVLKRAVRTKGAISADFHVHSARSLDSSAPLRDRVASFAAEGVEVMVSTDHDKHVDYASLIAAFGLGPRLRSIVGDEVTGSVPNPPHFPSSYGHINAWPLAVDANAPRDGAIHDEYVAPNWIYKRLRDRGAEVIQYNHPRAGVSGLTTIGLFNNIGCGRCANDIDLTCTVDADCPVAPAPRDCTCVGYQPDRPITMAPNDILVDGDILGPGTGTPNPDGLDNLDFDVMEVMNGARDSDFPGFRQVRRDWLSLLNQGIVRPGTAVSDSHRLTVEHPGWARTYVVGAGDDPAALDLAAFDARLKAGAMVMAAGPYVEFQVLTAASGRTGLGGLASAPNGRVRLRIRVRSAAWIPVEEVRVLANGFQVAAFDATTQPRVRPVPANFQAPGQTSRFRATLRMTVPQDTYFIVEAGAKLPPSPSSLPAPPPIVDTVEPGVVPTSVTNPIFVDVDGNASFDPPGLPVMTASATEGTRPAFARVRLESGPAESVWARLRRALAALASRTVGDAVAEKMPGEMTGVTPEQKREAVEKGEYFPLHEFRIPSEAVEGLRRRQQEEEAPPSAPPAEVPADDAER